MDDKNLEILMKNRTEEIKKEREGRIDISNVKEEEKIISDEVNIISKNESRISTDKINKVQKGNVFWKVLTLVFLIGANILWMMNANFKEEISELKLEVISLLDAGNSYTYEGETVKPSDILNLDNRILVSSDFVIEYINPDIHYSNSGARVYIPLENIDFMLETKSVTDYVKENIIDINVPILVKNGTKYIDFEILNVLYGLDVITATDGSFAMFKHSYSNIVSVDSKIEFIKSVHDMTDITESESKQVKAVILRVHDDTTKIIAENGKIGYVKTSDLNNYKAEIVDSSINVVRDDFDFGESLNMTWSQISQYKYNPDISLDETIPGLDAISPTWFSLNINGIMINEADFRYVRSAHEKDYKVWGLFSNSFKPSWTSEMINDEVYRKKTISQIAFYASLYDLDGVNIDFENMYLEDKDKFTQFIAELSSVLKEQNVVLSIAVTVPGGSDQWSKVFDRKAIARHVDFMMLMAYDEFWASSPISGPVASIPWVVKGIEETLEIVSSEKLILGIPLYMRVWQENGNSISSKSIGIKHLDGVIEDKDYTLEYDSDNMLNYITYDLDGNLHQIWVEDETSLGKRITLAYKYKLPGIGTWSKEFVEQDTWEYINELLD